MSLLLALGSGIALGVAFLWTWAQPLAWVGIALLGWALHRANGWRQAAAALLLAALVRQGVALHWWVGTAGFYTAPWLPPPFIVAFLGWTATGALSQVPLLALAALPVKRVPPRYWLPVGWVLGEAGLEAWSGFSMTHVLHSQWMQPPILRAVGFVGWVPTLVLCLLAAVCVGEAVALRSRRLLLPAVGVMVALAALPPLPVADDALQGTGVVHMASSVRVPESVPEATERLIWPESTVRGLQRGTEGRVSRPEVIEAFDARLPVPAIAGLTLRTPEGFFNAAAAFDGDGRLQETRGKSILVPIGERSIFGLQGRGEPLVASQARPLLSLAGRKVIPLICYEAFSRATALRGREAGGELLAVLASDLPLAGSRFAMDQAIGGVVMRAVELRMPAVRASLGGVAAVVSSDGRVLARSAPGASSILTVSPPPRRVEATQE
ncbi:nitrilase-related carbon-nitrogen hydrolase [Corallococcus carmarthensis]|uniref:CN hydrolase domain-containing protein n=1 Tax=Corallococcus carmarthensis TaxID=2316728 RepID=A0A3A8KGD3_9BACT|nr:nitrilase-related carbon-nitrogen hydrolase [Corallococcus carmarthensis]RKH07040.1 hypothetical protein D7X32_02905 [Corallococcus carmarthensis]